MLEKPAILDLIGSGLSYSEIWDLQKSYLEEIRQGLRSEVILFCEHERALTAGRRSKMENLLNREWPLYEIERGGDFTLHNPGQLVVYPLLKLNDRFGGIREYLRFLEETVIALLKQYGLDAGQWGPTGVWIKNSGETRKIASIGIAVRHWITYHGLALNISNSLDDFNRIRPCDFEASVMTSLQRENVDISFQRVKEELMNLLMAKLPSVRQPKSLVAPPELSAEELLLEA